MNDFLRDALLVISVTVPALLLAYLFYLGLTGGFARGRFFQKSKNIAQKHPFKEDDDAGE